MKPELLAPAGSMDSLHAAVEAGADAVYLGGRSFNARRSADNFDASALRQAIRYAHLFDVKVYVTINTLLYDDELQPALEFLADIYSWGADAAIVADLGLISAAKESVPIEMHGSTQMSVHDLNGALSARDLGLKRVILARELALEDVREISKEVATEVFVHGALCYSYSGQCLLSSMIDQRSGNRGTCAQPCRKRYSIKWA
jgi:putative protease